MACMRSRVRAPSAPFFGRKSLISERMRVCIRVDGGQIVLNQPGDSNQELRRFLQLLRRAGRYSGVFGAVLCTFAATRLYTDALMRTQLAVTVGLVGGLSFVIWISSLAAARALERLSEVRAEPTKREVRGWMLRFAGIELLAALGIGASGYVVFGLVGALVGFGAAALLFGANWARTIRRIRAYRRAR